MMWLSTVARSWWHGLRLVRKKSTVAERPAQCIDMEVGISILTGIAVKSTAAGVGATLISVEWPKETRKVLMAPSCLEPVSV
jgi:hypothetical protein